MKPQLKSFFKSKKNRLTILSIFIIGFLSATGKKVYDLAAPPTGEKNCDYIFPENPNQLVLDIPIPTLENINFEIQQKGGYINDASCLNKTSIFAIAQIRSENDIAEALKFASENNLKVTPAGEKHSMGGQSFSKGGLILDMHEFKKVEINKEKMTMNVQSGARWMDVQEKLDIEGLAVKAMQSINLFTVGGTIGVNAHGIAHNPGQIGSTIRSMRIMLPNGEIKKVSREENSELFKTVIGGYGLTGIILDVELDIVENEVFAWETDYVDYKDFSDYYDKNIKNNDEIGLFYARLSISPTSYLTEIAAHKYEKLDEHIDPSPLKGPTKVWLKRLIFNFSKTGKIGKWLRWTVEKNFEPGDHTCISRNEIMSGTNEEICIATRNQKMNQSMEYLNVRQNDTNILQEYFIPQENTEKFVDGLREIVKNTDVNLLNVTIRIVTKDVDSAIPYAKDDRIAYVLYFNQELNDKDSEKLKEATIQLIDLAIENDGTFYLPYQLHYSENQLLAAYPEMSNFFELKRKYDPEELITNKFYEKYGKK